MTRREALQLIAAALSVSVLTGCGEETPSIRFDRDSCEFCRMAISDRRFGGAARSSQGRVVRFDSIECLVAWLQRQPEAPTAIWLVDANTPGTLRPLAELRIHRTPPGTSPMGLGYVAVSAAAANSVWDGEVVEWSAVQPATSLGGR